MFDRILRRVGELVRSGDYNVTHHAQFELYDDDLTMIDLERVLLGGKIVEKQRDVKTGEAKYRIRGSLMGWEIEAIAKFGPDGELTILTIYSL